MAQVKKFKSGHPDGSKESRRVVLQKVIKDGHKNVRGKDAAWVTTALHEATHAVAYLRLAEHSFSEINVDNAITYGSGKPICSWAYATIGAVGPVSEERMRIPASASTEAAKRKIVTQTVSQVLEAWENGEIPENDDLMIPRGTTYFHAFPAAFAIVEHDWAAVCFLAEHLVEMGGVISSGTALELLNRGGFTEDGIFPEAEVAPWVERYMVEVARQGDPDLQLAGYYEYMEKLAAA